MGANDLPRPGQFEPQGLDWQDLCRGTINKKKIFEVFPIISLWELITLGHGQFEPQGLDWQDLCRGPLNIATY